MPFKNKNGNKNQRFKSKRGSGHFHKRNPNNYGSKVDKPEYRHKNQLTESEVGITEYISKLEGYPAVIKARFSDFQVNEISLEGKLAKLTDISIPKDFQQKLKIFSYEDAEQSPIKEIPQEIWEAMKSLVKNPDGEAVLLNINDLSKDDRRNLHRGVRSYFGQKIVASTIKKDEKTFMEFKKYRKISDHDDRQAWPEDKPEFVHFLVYKELLDTMDACLKISHQLKIPPMKLTYAGVKDRRAKTTQWYCVKKVAPWKIMKANLIRHIKIGNIEFKKNCLKLGQLSGNRFRIALRNVIADDELITQTMEHIKQHGFINYYGLQRFGNDKEAPTFSIGIKLLQGEWEEAVNLVLKVKAADDLSLEINQAKKLFSETGNAEEALKLIDMGRNNSLEAKLLQGLSKHIENDYVNALENIPRSMRLMYIHAFQSFIWNKMVSKRIQEFGLNPAEGDLILVDNLDEVESTFENNNEDEIAEGSDESKEKASVRALTLDELDKYTIYDIVLPMPGYDIIYPENMKQWYKEAIEESGLSLEMPKQKVKTYNLSGTYRKLLGRTKDFEWKIMYYNDPTDNLILSDVDELRGDPEPESVEGGKFKSVVVAFTLDPASYATMALREILKCNTSSSAQAQLNDYNKSNENSAKPEKVILESTEDDKNYNSEVSDDVQPDSLLANKEKYEDFKNNLFKDILEEPVKRKAEDQDDTDSKKLKSSVV